MPLSGSNIAPPQSINALSPGNYIVTVAAIAPE